MRRLLFLALTLALFASQSGTAVGFMLNIYTDKAEWESAVEGQFLTEDFNDLLLNSGISYVASESGNINVNFGYYHDVLMSASANEPITIWTFSPRITAYGGTWTLGGPGGTGNSLLVYMDNLDQPVGAISNNYAGDFWGFISDTPFTSVFLLGGEGSNQQIYQLDDMVYCPVE